MGFSAIMVVSSNKDTLADAVIGALTSTLQTADQASVDKLYSVLNTSGALGYIDPLLEKLRARRDLQSERTHALASWLATRAADREPVKVGIALLGLFPQPADEDVLLTLGRHEEFTLFSAVALTNSLSNSEPALWTLAKGVDGWGRIHVVERLTKTSNPEIKAWLIRDGYKNSVMYEYLAYKCAVGGDLAKELAKPEIDDGLFEGAGEILSALIAGQGGPAEGIDDYENAATAVESYLHQAQRRAQTLKHLLAVEGIKNFLGENDGWDERAEKTWTPAVGVGSPNELESGKVVGPKIAQAT
jgi:hypothetical protein